MTRAEFKEKSFEEVMEQLYAENDDIWTMDSLKECVKYAIDDDTLFLAIHILEAMQNDDAEWYSYDYTMGTLQTPSGITEKEHVEHLIED